LKIAGVICEFNPFHNGHKYLLDEIKQRGFDATVCVMSGSFTQRGDVAVYDKFKRTKAALGNGADLVIELPAPYAVASAQIFARGGAEIIKATGVVDTVFFGSECGDVELLKKAATATKAPEVEALLKEYMNAGDYYPLALEKAVKDTFGSEISAVLKSPNNTLAVEYIKELWGSSLEVDTVTRVAVEHDSMSANKGFASASLLREMILNKEDISPFVPTDDFSNPAFMALGERAVIYKLRSMSLEDFEKLPDVNEGLHNRIFGAVRDFNSIEEILAEIKTKRYTLARLRRIIACALLDITKELQAAPVPYLRILGITEKGKEVLSQISKHGALPIVTSVAASLRTLEEKAQKILLCDVKATDLRTVFEENISGSARDFTSAIIKL